jgi:hypothetical protein
VTYHETSYAEIHDLDPFRRVATGFRVATDWLETGRRGHRDRLRTARCEYDQSCCCSQHWLHGEAIMAKGDSNRDVQSS